MNSMSVWDMLELVNRELRKYFLCIPPYRSPASFVMNIKKLIDEGKDPSLPVRGEINLPARRAYQMEYRYKQCRIFKPFLPAIEYATYDAMSGNWICAYLSFLPIVEAVLRKWAEEDPSLSFNKMKGFAPKLIEYLSKIEYYDDERIQLTNNYIKYLQYILCNVLYEDFDGYKNKSFGEIFNRNLSLHKLEGVMDISEGLSNVTRIMLVLDIIAELYFMQTPAEYWNCTFYAEPQKNIDYMLHWNLYIKRSMLSIGPDDLLIVGNAFVRGATDEKKKIASEELNREIKHIQLMESLKVKSMKKENKK